ncbi:MAG: AAA family ATPase [Cyanobacteriota bacterium]|nr:AAA family ATPase [Cyanobacteriota bacterium]
MPPVPRLDLAPKLNRPLQLWNPLDYLRLLYWVFFFPQALRWYVDTFGGGYIPESEMNWQNTVQRQLFFQGLLLTISVPWIICGYLAQVDFTIDWPSLLFGVVAGVVAGVVFSVGVGVVFGVVFSVGVGVVFGVAFGVSFGVEVNMVLGVSFGAVAGVVGNVLLGMEVSMVLGAVRGVEAGVAAGVGLGVGVGVGFSVLFGVVFSVGAGVAAGVLFGVVFSVGVGVAIVRPENWLVGLPFNLRSLQNGSWLMPRITLLPLPHLSRRVQNWLRQDWETGLHNINQLLAYTLQFIPAVAAVNRVLAETAPERLIFYVSQLAEFPQDWDLVRFASASLSQKMKSQAMGGLLAMGSLLAYFPQKWKQPLLSKFDPDTRLDTFPRATAAGFWYLYAWKPHKASEAFAVVRSLLYGEEMYLLAQTLETCCKGTEFDTIAQLQLPPPPAIPHLRPTTWTAIAHLRHVVEDSRLVQQSASHAARSFALNRALGELTTLLSQSETLPEAERGLIVKIAQTWKDILLQETGTVGDITITKPVSNPYIIGDPVEGIRFVGRDDILRQLEELWVMGQQLQSVVIYGHRRMGKTSILRNAANRLGARIRVAYVNLQQVSDAPQGVGEVLVAICDEISATVGLPPPEDDKLLSQPHLTFKRYLRRVETHLQTQLDNAGLIIALDEFEQIEELIEKGQIDSKFMGFLRGSIQQSPKIAFALAGLHTLDEMTADYFQPFFASVLPIRVKFLTSGATHTILANPDDGDFPLDYTRETLDGIYQLTAGQPYLVQLIGFQLVRRYNDWVFDAGRSREPRFTPEDLAAVIDNPEFFQRGRYYFTGVWNQAAQGASGQQAVLTAIAPHPDGLPRQELEAEIGLDATTLENAITTLIRHDVIEEKDGNLRIIVELFRRWVGRELKIKN